MNSPRLVPLTDIPSVTPDHVLADLIRNAADAAGVELRNGVLVVCQKIVSKAEGRIVHLADVTPSATKGPPNLATDRPPSSLSTTTLGARSRACSTSGSSTSISST